MTDEEIATALPVSDADLLAELAAVLSRVAGPPPEVVQAAKDLFTWRTIDAELAALAHDSLLDAAAPVRAAAGPRILSFAAGALTIEVEVDERPSGRRLLGQLVPAQAARLELVRSDPAPRAVATAAADELGRFVLPLPTELAPVRVRARLADGTTVESAAVAL